MERGRVCDGINWGDSMKRKVKEKTFFDDIIKELWSTAIANYGKKAQMQKAREELKELDDVIKTVYENLEKLNQLDLKRGKDIKTLKQIMPDMFGKPYFVSNHSGITDNKDAFWYDVIRFRLLEEGADVLNMIGQICVMFDIRKKDMTDMMQYKMYRTAKRIDIENTEKKSQNT
jgi:hypothetical protein